MAAFQQWIGDKFVAWEKDQGRKQSYYAFARFLEVSQSGLGLWMIGASVPSGDDLINTAGKLGMEIYDILGLPRPNVELQRLTVSFAGLPPDLRERLASAIAEADQALRAERLRPDAAEARPIVLAILAKWGFHFTG